MKKRMIKLMTIFCMAGILTVNPAIIGLAEEAEAVGADVSEGKEEVEEKSVEEETEPEEEPAAEEDVEEVSEEKPETETEKSDVVLEEEAGEVSEAVMMSVNEAAMPVMMAAENGEKGSAEGQYVFTYIFEGTKKDTSSFDDSFLDTYTLKESPQSITGYTYTKEGYDFIGWEKGGKIYSPGATYEVTDEDRKSKNITFTAVWRQQVSLSVDGEKVPSQTAMESIKEVSYDLSNIKPSEPSGSYEFADKWVINNNGTPCDATNTMTVKFEDNNDQIYNAVSVNVDGKTNVKTDNNIKLTSCWNLVDGQYNLRIENKTTGTLTAKQTEAAVNEIIEINNVSDKDDIEFKKGNWTLKKPVSDLAEGSIKYVNKDGKYYQYRESTIKDSDFEKTVTYTYQDDFTDTTFSNTGTGTATIHPGEGQTWKSVLPDATAARGKFTFAGWRYFLNGNESIDPEKTIINFYKDEEHSLTVKPIWKGSYSYKPNFPTNQGPEKDPVVKEQEVGTVITLPTFDNIAERYTFEGWLDSDRKAYNGGESYTIKKANETFTGQWKAVPHKLTFVDEDKRVYSEGTADFNTPITWPSKPTKEGYTFQNWLVEINEDEIRVEHGAKFIMQDHDITFIAKWSINSYKISYDGNGAAMGVPAETVEQNYQTDYTIDTVVPTKTGYTFQGWSDGTTTYQPGAVFKVPARDVVLTAQWKANSHQVKYDGNGGKTSAPESKSADYNSNVSVAAGLEKDGYLFDGWEQISTGKVLTPGASFVMPDMDETLKAKWKIAYTGIYEAGVYYLIQGQPYILGPGRKVQGDSSTYTANVTIYVPQSGYYTFE